MAVFCPACDVVPPEAAAAGSPCAACGARLMVVDLKDPLIGTVIEGRFEILARLGQGGMGTVYRARQRSIGREVAIKVLDARADRDPASVKRFYREAKLASALQHPNTVHIIEFGQNSEGRLYIAMELLRGRTLQEETQRVGRLPVARIREIGAQLCDALDAAHRMSIVHRDLKLENVMLLDGPRDHVKILDFGLALMLDDPNTRATGTGLVSGTPRYMPPEVALEGAAPSPPQDMYAVGVMLAELSIGKALWTAPTIEQLFMRKVDTARDERALADVPHELRVIVRQLLSEQPASRPVADAVRALLRDPVALAELANRTTAVRPSQLVEGSVDLSPGVAPTLPPTTLVDPMPAGADAYAIDASKLVGLDERTDAPKGSLADGPSVRPPREVRASKPPIADPFAAPVVGDALPLEVDPSWSKQREEVQARAAVVEAQAKKPKSPIPRYVAIVAILAILGVTGVVIYQRMNKPVPAAPEVGGAGVTIRIKSLTSRTITVDGRAAGKAPFSLKLPTGNTPVMIESPGIAPFRVIPDRDREIDLDSLVRED